MDREVFPIHDLPEEVLEHIFSFLPLSDRKSASLVCTLWERLSFCRRFLRKVALKIRFNGFFLRRSKRRYRNVFVILYTRDHNMFCFEDLIMALELFAADVESFQCLGYLNTEQLCMVLSHFPNLQQLIVGLNIYDDYEGFRLLPSEPHADFELQIERLDVSNLTQLSIIIAEPTDGRKFLPILRRLASQLKSVDLYSTDYFIPLELLQFPKVEVLKIGGSLCDAENDRDLRTFFAGFKLLNEVRLDSTIEEIALDTIIRACPGIEFFKMKGPRVNPIPFHLLGRLKHLKTLGLGEVNDVPESSLKLNRLTSVKTLRLKLSKCEESLIERLRHLLPNVIAMDVTLIGDWNIKRGLRHICQSFRGLQSLNLSDGATWLQTTSSSLLDLKHLDQLEELTFKKIRTRIVDIPPNPLLKRFVMNFPCLLSDEDLLEMARQYPNLRVLELGPYRQLSSEGIAAFKSQLVNCAVHYIPYAKNSVSKQYRNIF